MSRAHPRRHIRVFQHVPFEGPALIGEWLASRGHRIETTRLYEWAPGDELPAVSDYDWLVVMGGPMSVWESERFPWLPYEQEAIGDAVAAGRTVLGICLGAQLIAAALGARVYPNYYREIGWFPVSVVEQPGAADRAADHGAAEPAALADSPAELFSRFAPDLPALHWHGDTFALPFEATHLARTDACVNQAFSVGERVLGLQFHLEATPESAAALCDGAAGDLTHTGPYVASRETILSAQAPFERSNTYMEAVLSYLEHHT